MIISASRRTDIPAHYSDWLFNRLKEGYVLVRNPMNYHQVGRVSLAPQLVDGIVFWTKNPAPMLDRLRELDGYMYYFQFTVTPYGRDVEPYLPPMGDVLAAFKRLSDAIGPDRVIWRYDPILIDKKYSADYHLRAFHAIAEKLDGYTRKVIISFIDRHYRGVKSSSLSPMDLSPQSQGEICAQLAQTAWEHGLAVEACAQLINLAPYGIGRAHCVDHKLLARLLGCSLNVNKDKHQRRECGCSTSIDIGAYNTCTTGCQYCYANYSRSAIQANLAAHDPLSPLITGALGPEDVVYERAIKSFRAAP